MDSFDPWAILGVGPEASPAEVKAAWRALAVQFHPDRYAAAPVADQHRAAAHMTAVNIAYDEIRSGRARAQPVVSSTPMPGDFGSGSTAGGFGQSGPEPGVPWFDEEVLVAALRRAEERRRSWHRRGRQRVVGAIVGVAVLAMLLHLTMLRTYGYDYVSDGQGNVYTEVDCGNGYDRGQTAAAELRDRAAASPSGAALVHEAEVIELVCDDWTGAARAMVVPVLFLFAGAFYLLFLRRRR